MNIGISYLQTKIFQFKDQLLPSLTAQQKKILLVASLALSAIAALFFFCCYVFKGKKKDEVATDELSEKTQVPGVDLSPRIPIIHPELVINSTSSVIFNKSTGQYVYLSPAPPIKNVVISGGGAKGVILPGVLKAFEEHRIGEDLSFRDQLDNLAGSSIGAVTACLIAVGISSEDLIAATGNEDFKALLGKGWGPIFKDGKPLLDFIRTHIQKTISKHLFEMSGKEDLDDIDVEELVKNQFDLRDMVSTQEEVNALVVEIQEILEVLKNEDINKISITFSMLRSLRKLNPYIFKELTVTATCRENGQTYYFDADTTPLLDIALGSKASAALPIVLNPVKIEPQFLLPGYVHQKAMTFSDGGFLDNIPTRAMEKKQGEGNLKNKGEQGQNLQTLVLVFDETAKKEDEQSPFHDELIDNHALYDPTGYMTWLVRDVIAKRLGRIKTKERNTINKAKGLEEVRKNYTQRNIPLKVGIKTTDFDQAKKDEQKYIEKGYKQGMEYFFNHESELICRSFNSFHDLLAQIPEEDKKEHFEKILKFKMEKEEGTSVEFVEEETQKIPQRSKTMDDIFQPGAKQKGHSRSKSM